MSRSTALLVLPSGRSGDDEQGATRTAALLLAQSPEDLGLAERVERALCATGYLSLRAVEVSACDGQIVLRGRVPSYYMKQVAQAVGLAIAGVRGLHNHLDVV